MKLGENIRALREQFSFSQEILAEKVFVSRQTISNWENNKSYPDLHSLILLAQTFNTSIDELIKGDLNIMKETIKEENANKFSKLSLIFNVLFLVTLITPIPLFHFFDKTGLIIWIIIFAASMYVAVLVEKEKKKYNIQTYKEIIAFTEGKKLDEITKAREEGKRPYQKIMLAVLSAIFTVAIGIIFIKILN